MLFALPEYEATARRAVFTAAEALARAQSPLLALMESEPVSELHPTRVSSDRSTPLRLEPMQIAGALELDIRPICDGRLDELLRALDALGDEQAHAITPVMFDRLRQLTAATGNQVDVAGRELTHELIFEVLDKLDIAFDDQGQAQLTLGASPDVIAKLQALPEMSAGQQKTFDDLIARKRAQFEATRRQRRLR
jgi:hypothetical protein